MNPHKHLYAIERRNARMTVRAIEVQIASLERRWSDPKVRERERKLTELQIGIRAAYNLRCSVSYVESIDRWINFKAPYVYLRMPKRSIKRHMTSCGIIKAA